MARDSSGPAVAHSVASVSGLAVSFCVIRSDAYRTAMQRLRPLSETECYLRCYGWRGSEETVKVLRSDAASLREAPSVLAERIRLALEASLDAREPAEAA